jgi:DNA-binding CsgD family transcriptional regulator
VSLDVLERGDRLGADETAAVWTGIAEGRWRIVAVREATGRRVVVVRRQAGAALSRRERTAVALAALGRSNKEIAYALGVAVSTAAGLLAAAARRVGVRSRRELIATFGPAASPAAPEPRDGAAGV